MQKKIQKNLLTLLTIFFTIITRCMPFQFKAPIVSVNPSTINTPAQYTIYIQRQFTQSLTTTPWNTVAVPAGSTIVAQFPPEYLLTGSELCDFVAIGTDFPTFTCTVNVGTKTITINDAVPSNTFISDVTLSISNVLNPFPAITTSPFTVLIGADNSAIDTNAAVSLTAAQFTSSTLEFSPNTVNTTGNMVFTIITTNKLPIGSSIIIKFPYNLQWTEDVSTNHQLQLNSSMSCSSLSAAISTSVQCTGLASTQQVTITSLSSSQIPSGQIIKFSVNNLFSPPTQGQVDNIVVTSIITNSSNSYQIDTITSKITGITARTLTDLTIVPTSSTKTINTNIGLRVSFTVLDTITNADYFQIAFPIGTTITYTTSLSTFSLASNVTYSSSTGILTFYQSAVSVTRFAGFSANITFLTYRTPNSTKPTDPIVFRVMKNGHAKMRGSSVFVADPKTYPFSVSTNSTSINAYASYTLSFILSDALQRSGYIIVTIPPQLIVTTLSASLSSNATLINPSPSLTVINSTSFSLKNLNRTSGTTSIAIQSLNMTITGLIQPNSARNISSFGFTIFLSDENFATANGAQSNTITIGSGSVSNVSVAISVSTTATNGQLTILSNIQNRIDAGGYYYITLPSDITLITPLTCSLTSFPTQTTIYSQTCTNITASTLQIQIATTMPALSQTKLTISLIRSPISTLTTSVFAITTTNANNLTIDVMSNTTAASTSITMGQPVQLQVLQINRATMVNFDTGDYYVTVQIVQTMYSNTTNYVYMEFPSEITVISTSNLTVKLINNSTGTSSTLSYNLISQSPLKISIQLPSTQTTLTNASSFTITGLTNPPSLRSTSTGININVGFNRTEGSNTVSYLYSTGISTNIQNSVVSDFTSLGFTYSVGFLYSDTNLTLNIGLIASSKVFGIQLQLDTSLQFKQTTLSLCTCPQLAINCTVTGTSPSIVLITPQSGAAFNISSLSITLGIISTPTTYSASYPASTLTSIDSANFAISRNTNTIKFVVACQVPCFKCVAGQPTQCTACFPNTTNITSLIYYTGVTGQTYGQCLAQCSSGYYINGTGSYICLPCNSNCLQCNGSATNCTSCPASNYLYTVTNSCVSTCPNGTYPSTSNSTKICATCPTGCALCSSPTICSKCSTGYYLYNNMCSNTCPVNTTIANTSTLICDLCSSSCQTCQGTINNCTSCAGGLVLNNGSCLSSCSSISMIPINGTCTACSSFCLTCSVVTTNCTSCYSNSTLKYLYNGSCLNQCPSTFYAPTSNICTSCSNLNIGCLNCSSNGQSCLSCDSGYVFFNSSQCLNYTPNGYINISGNATPCSTACLTCSVTTSNCTSCASPSLFYLNTCLSICPNSTTAVNGTCLTCNSTCTSCSGSVNYCLTCQTGFFLNSLTHQCVNSSSCPNYTYPNSTSSSCASCVSPCLQCTTSISCSSCVRGFYFQSITTLCLDVCPPGYVGVVDVCLPCISPCRYCQTDQNYCLSCVSGYYLNTYTHQCLLQCPPQVTISNPITMTCDICTNSCLTCIGLTSQCTSCISGRYLIGAQCVLVCPNGYYGDALTSKCQNCSTTCKTCSSSPTQCTSCYSGLYYFNNSCISVCPVTYGIVDANNSCVICSAKFQNCVTCSSARCMQCVDSAILLDGKCYTQCPSGYVLSQGTCKTTDQNAQKTLSNTLSSSSVFPMPFTCIGFSIFISFLMSKLQNKNTYLIGSAYALTGILETSSLIYLVVKYIQYDQPLQATTSSVPKVDQFPIITVGIIIIYAINFIGLIVQTPILCSDIKFQSWLKNSFHRFFFVIITILSCLTNYKLKLVLFSKLYNFNCTRGQLQNIQKFRVFNILSFLGVSHQIFVIYISIVMLTKLPATIINNQLFLVFIDTMVITFLAILFSILANKKDDDFFVELADGGYVLNKKVMAEGDDLGKDGLQAKFLRGEENKLTKANHMDSFQKMISQEHQEIYEDQQLALSISQNKSQIDKRQKPQKTGKNKQKVSQPSDNEILSQKNAKNLKLRQNIIKSKFSDQFDESSNPINKDLFNKREKDNQFNDQNHQIGNSVIFERNKQYDDDQVGSKNQSVVVQSPSKSTGKQKHSQMLIIKNNNSVVDNIDQVINLSNAHHDKNAKNKLLNQQKQLDKKSNNTDMDLKKQASAYGQNAANDNFIQDSGKDNNNQQQRNKIQSNNELNNKSESNNISNNINPFQKDTDNKITIDDNENIYAFDDTDTPQNLPNNMTNIVNGNDVNDANKNSQNSNNNNLNQKAGRGRHENQTKIFKQQKNLNKQLGDDEQIKRKIALKVKELEVLKKQSSHKQLKKERSRQKLKSSKNQKMLFQQQEQPKLPKNQQSALSNKNKQKQKSQKSFKQEQLNFKQIGLNTNTSGNAQELIVQESALIKNQMQNQKDHGQAQLKEEVQHQSIREELDSHNQNRLSKLQARDIIREGSIFHKSKTGKSALIDEEISQSNNKSLKNNNYISKNKKQQESKQPQQLIQQQPLQHRNPQHPTLKNSTKLVQQYLQTSTHKPHGHSIEKKAHAQGQANKIITENVSANSSPSQNKSHKSKNVEDMYDSVVRVGEQLEQPGGNSGKPQFNYVEQLQENMSDEEEVETYNQHHADNRQTKHNNKNKKGGIDVGIGQSLQNMLQSNNAQNNQGSNNKNRYKDNVFQFQDQQQQLEDSGLQDSQPYMDQQINHRPMKSSFATDRRSIDITKTDDNSGKHPLIGILQSGQQAISTRNPVSRTVDERQVSTNREQTIQTKMNKYNPVPPTDQKTMRKYPQKPPIQRPSTNEKNRIYAAGLRQFGDPSLAQKSSLEHPLNEKSSKLSLQGSSGEIEMKKQDKKRNRSLYDVNLKKMESRESKDNSSEQTQQILLKPGYFNQNSSTQQIGFTQPKYTSTMLVDNVNQIPEKPKVGLSARGNRTSTSQQRGGRMRIEGSTTVGDRMFTKKESIQYDKQDDEDDELDDFYGKQRQGRKNRSPKRSKSREKKQSKQSTKRMKQIQKVYLQRLQPPVKRKY